MDSSFMSPLDSSELARQTEKINSSLLETQAALRSSLEAMAPINMSPPAGNGARQANHEAYAPLHPIPSSPHAAREAFASGAPAQSPRHASGELLPNISTAMHCAAAALASTTPKAAAAQHNDAFAAMNLPAPPASPHVAGVQAQAPFAPLPAEHPVIAFDQMPSFASCQVSTTLTEPSQISTRTLQQSLDASNFDAHVQQAMSPHSSAHGLNMSVDSHTLDAFNGSSTSFHAPAPHPNLAQPAAVSLPSGDIDEARPQAYDLPLHDMAPMDLGASAVVVPAADGITPAHELEALPTSAPAASDSTCPTSELQPLAAGTELQNRGLEAHTMDAAHGDAVLAQQHHALLHEAQPALDGQHAVEAQPFEAMQQQAIGSAPNEMEAFNMAVSDFQLPAAAQPKEGEDGTFQQLLGGSFTNQPLQLPEEPAPQGPAYNAPPEAHEFADAAAATAQQPAAEEEAEQPLPTMYHAPDAAALPPSGHSLRAHPMPSGGGGSTDTVERENTTGKSQKSSGNPAVQVSRQIYNEFKEHVSGSRLLGGDKGWPLGKLLQMATKRMQAYMEQSKEQHDNTMEKFTLFQKARRQKLPGSSLARSGIRLPTDVLLSLKDMLGVEDVEVWGMRRFLIEFLLSSSMGQVDGLPAWLERGSTKDQVAKQMMAMEDIRSAGWIPSDPPVRSSPPENWVASAPAVKSEQQDMHLVEPHAAPLQAQPPALEDLRQEVWLNERAVLDGHRGGGGAYAREGSLRDARFRQALSGVIADVQNRPDRESALLRQQEHGLALSAQVRALEDIQGSSGPFRMPSLGSRGRGAQFQAAGASNDMLHSLLHSLNSQVGGFPELSGGNYPERSFDVVQSLGLRTAGSLKMALGLTNMPLSLASCLDKPNAVPPQGFHLQGGPPGQLGMALAHEGAAPEDEEQYTLQYMVGGQEARGGSPEGAFAGEKRLRRSSDEHLSAEYSREDPGSGRYKQPRSRAQRSRKPNSMMSGYVPGVDAGGDKKRQKVSPNASHHISGEVPPSNSGQLAHMHSTAHSSGNLATEASPRAHSPQVPPPANQNRGRKNPISMKGAAKMLMALGKPGHDAQPRGNVMRTRRNTGDCPAPEDSPPRELPPPEKLQLERDALFSALRMRMHEPRPGKTGPKDCALTQHVQRIICQSGMADTNVVRDAANNITHLRLSLCKGNVQVQLPTYGLVGSVREGAMLCALLTCHLPSGKRSTTDPPTELRQRARNDMEIVSNICTSRLKQLHDVDVDVPLTPPDAADAAVLKGLEYPTELRSYVTMFRLMDAWHLDSEANGRLEDLLGSRKTPGSSRHSTSASRGSLSSRTLPPSSEAPAASPPEAATATATDLANQSAETQEGGAAMAVDAGTPGVEGDSPAPGDGDLRTDHTLVLGGQVMDRSKVELGQLLRTQVAEKESEITKLQELVDQVQAVQTAHGVRATLKTEVTSLEASIADMQAKLTNLLALRERVVAKLGPEAEDKSLDAVVSKIVAVTESLNDDVAYMLMGARTMMPEKLLKYFFPDL